MNPPTLFRMRCAITGEVRVELGGHGVLSQVQEL